MKTANKTPKTHKKSIGAKRKPKDFTFHIPQEEMEHKIVIHAPLSIKQETYLNDTTNDVIVWGGAASAGKTQLSLLQLMLNGMWDKNYVGGIARQSIKQMKMAGSLWSTGCKLFAPYGITSNKIENTWNFPSGAEVKCHYLDNNTDDWHGSQMTQALVDEAQQCKEDDVWFLTSRLRSMSKQKHQLRLTCNPLATSFLCDWLVKAGYIGEDGFPIPERDGVTTYLLQVEGDLVWYNTKKEMIEAVGEEHAEYSMKFVFYSANVYDNPYVRKHLPQYVHKLENQNATNRARYLLGNWFVREENDGYIDREWFKEIGLSDVPVGLPQIRSYDLASTKPHAGNKNPDWTRGVKATYNKETGEFYIIDMVSTRDSPAMVQALIEETANKDGRDCYISIPVDAGASGVVVAEQKKGRLSVLGHKVILDKTRKGKLARAEPFLIALQEGKVYVVRGTLSKGNMDELESFDGHKNAGKHDDIVDAISSCFNALTGNSLIPTIKMSHKQTQYRNLGGRTLL